MEKITVKQYMTKPATPDFDFMAKWNLNRPMPLRTMVGEVLQETKGMVKMRLHGDITSERTAFCLKCGRPLTNPVSAFFGMGPECGGHGYTNPFSSEEELRAAVSNYRGTVLRNIQWEGWIIRSAIERRETVGTDGEGNVLFVESLNLDESVVKASEKPAPEPEPEPYVPPMTSVNGLSVAMRIGKPTACKGRQSVYCSFEYRKEAVDYIKSLRRRHYDPETKSWEIPGSMFTEVRKAFEGSGAAVTVTGDELLTEKVFDTVSEIPAWYHFKTKPFPHQEEAFLFSLNRNSSLLALDMGLGKSFIGANLGVFLKSERAYRHCLIVCLNSLVWNWKDEIATHTDEECVILGERVKKKTGRHYVGTRAEKLEDLEDVSRLPYFVITNVETLRDEKIAKRLRELSLSNDLPMVVVDEIHKFKNTRSQQGKGLAKLESEFRLALTGTPILNNPLDSYAILDFLGLADETFWEFKQRYCIYGGYENKEIIGYRNELELRDRIAGHMLRKKKSEVLDLPPKICQNDIIDMPSRQAKIYADVLSEMQDNIDKIRLDPNPLTSLIRLRQATGYPAMLSSSAGAENAKFDRAEEIIEAASENGEKVIVFSNWTAITEPFAKRVAKYHPVVITGETASDERQELVRRFQNDPSVKVAICTIGAAGTGLTLTAASVEIFLDEPWNKGLKDQAEDRAYRIGQQKTLNVHTLLCRGTIDEKIHQLVEKKGETAAFYTDGAEIIRQADLAEFLVS